VVASRPRLDRRSTTLIIAAVLALLTGWLTFNYLTSYGRQKSATVAPRAVVVASKAIPARAQITDDMVTTVMRPGDAIDPDSLSAPAAAVGKIAAVSIPAGGTVTASKVVAVAQAALVTHLPRGMRAISIPLDRVRGVANLIQPGDHVDVIAVAAQRQGVPSKAATVLRDVPVLAMGAALETAGGATPSPDGYATATLELTPQQAALLTLIDLNATIRLDLRSPGDAGPHPMLGEPLDLSSVVAAPRPAPAPAAAPVAPVPIQRLPPMPPPVQVINGDKVIQ
jgi:pilus assembly protein CpaB